MTPRLCGDVAIVVRSGCVLGTISATGSVKDSSNATPIVNLRKDRRVDIVDRQTYR
jgi:hypothetical protein